MTAILILFAGLLLLMFWTWTRGDNAAVTGIITKIMYALILALIVLAVFGTLIVLFMSLTQ
jgi:hypothetical protein